MYGNDPAFVASVRSSNEEFPQWQLVVRARGGRWARWDDADLSRYSTLARDATVDGQWANLDDWHPVDPEPCDECGHYQAPCGFCRHMARHFLDADWVVPHVYLCDECIEPFSEYMEADPQGAWKTMELGAYACCDGCGCDGWR